MPKHTREQHREANRRAWALGIFVQEFELMVDATRQVSQSCTGISPNDEMLVAVMLTHQSLGANALFEIMRGVIGERWRYLTFPDDRRKRLTAIISQIGKEYQDLASMRNNLLHGTWRVHPADLSLQIHKWRAKLDEGLRPVDDVPTSARAFVCLARRCRFQAKMILPLGYIVMNNDYDPDVYYRWRNRRWETNWPHSYS